MKKPPAVQPSSSSRPWQLLVLSAKTDSRLGTTTANLADYLQQHPDLDLADVAYTLQVSHRAFSHRRTAVCQDIKEAVVALQDPKQVLTNIQETDNRPVAFMFTGLGPHYINMAWELYQVEPTFQEQVDRGCELLKPLLEIDLREVLYPTKNQIGKVPQAQNSAPSTHKSGLDLRQMLGRGEKQVDASAQRLNQTYLTQPAIFVIEYALAQLWQSWGIYPQAMLGYSIGEYVAACLAGVLSLEDAMTLVAKRAQMIQALPGGAMLAVPLSEQEVSPLLDKNLSLSAINGSSLCVIAGTTDAVDELEHHLAEKGLACRRLVTSHAFHSHMMEPISESLTELVKTISLHPPKIPYVSNVTGTWITAAEATDPSYWTRHLCQPVRFAEGVNQLWKIQNPVLLEVGPGQTLGSLTLQCLECDRSADKVVLPSLRHSYDRQPDLAFLLNTLGQLWLSGVQIDWSGFYAREHRYRVPLPTDLFEHQHDWIEPQNTYNIKRKSTDQRHGLKTAYVSPSNEIERKIVDHYQELLGIEQVGIHDNFFDLGGHSLKGTQLISQLRKDFQVELPLRFLFESPTVAKLALVIEEMLIGELEALTEDEAKELVSASSNPEQVPGMPVNQRRYKLPNNLELVHQSKAETDYFYQDIFENQVYLKHGITLSDRACVFDVGANIGLFTLLVSQKCRNPIIYAFEPAPPLFEILRLNADLHKVNVKLFNCGLSNETKTATFTFYPNSSGMSSFYADREEEKQVLKAIMLNQLRSGMVGMEQVMEYSDELLEERFKSQTFACQLKTLSEVISENNIESIDLLKIDVQKSELEVMKGLQVEDWQKIKQIVIEVHDTEGRLGQITDLLKMQGYNVVAEQEDLYDGSNIHNVYAARSASNGN